MLQLAHACFKKAVESIITRKPDGNHFTIQMLLKSTRFNLYFAWFLLPVFPVKVTRD